MTIYVRIDTTIQVELPEGDDKDSDGTVTKERRDRAIEAAVCAVPQKVYIYIDGEQNAPATIHTEVTDDDVTEVWEE